MGQASPSSPGAPRASCRQKQKNPAPSAQILSGLETQGPVVGIEALIWIPSTPVQWRPLCPCPCLGAPCGQRRKGPPGEGDRPVQQVTLSVSSQLLLLASGSGQCPLLSPASCSRAVSVLPPQALTRLPPLPSGTCPAAPPLHLVAHRGAVLIAPDLSCRAQPLPCGLGVLSPSRWPSTSSGSITGPSAWPIPRRDCELAQGLGPREAAPPQSGPSLSHRGRDQEKGGGAKGLGLERGQAPGQKGP